MNPLVRSLSSSEEDFSNSIFFCPILTQQYFSRITPIAQPVLYPASATSSLGKRKIGPEHEELKLSINNKYFREIKHDLPDGKVTIDYNDDGITYRGHLVMGKHDGWGKLTKLDKTLYEGYWRDGKKHGFGKKTYDDGSVYEGHWEDDHKCGYGKLTYHEGRVFEGNFKNDKRCGFGKMTYLNGEVYIGNWLNGSYHGYGTLVYSKSDSKHEEHWTKYEGEWINGQRCGCGQEITNDYTYKGEFKDNQPFGSGTFFFSNEDRLECENRNGKPDGFGVFTCSNGYVYMGEFDELRLLGKGTILNSNYTILLTGLWEHGEEPEDSKFIVSENEVYQGKLGDILRSIPSSGQDSKN